MAVQLTAKDLASQQAATEFKAQQGAMEMAAQQQQQLVPPRVISPQGGPSGSVNLVWQKRQDGGWAMGGNGVDLRPP